MTSAPKTPLGAPVTSHSPWWLLLVALARSPGPPAGGCPLSCIIYSRSRLAQHVLDMCSLSSAHVLAPPTTSEALPISLGQDEPPGAPFLLELRPAPGPLHVPYPTPGCPFPNWPGRRSQISVYHPDGRKPDSVSFCSPQIVWETMVLDAGKGNDEEVLTVQEVTESTATP